MKILQHRGDLRSQSASFCLVFCIFDRPTETGYQAFRTLEHLRKYNGNNNKSQSILL